MLLRSLMNVDTRSFDVVGKWPVYLVKWCLSGMGIPKKSANLTKLFE